MRSTIEIQIRHKNAECQRLNIQKDQAISEKDQAEFETKIETLQAEITQL